MISLLGATVGALIFFWSRELFGAWGGFVSPLLFIFCPNMLAHGALATFSWPFGPWIGQRLFFALSRLTTIDFILFIELKL